MITIATIFVSGWVISKLPDCGQVKYKREISLAQSLVVDRAPLNIPVTEMPRGNGKFECVRLEFSIDKFGHAAHVSVAEGSGSYVLSTSAMRAIKRYRFRVPTSHKMNRYTIVLNGNVGAAPPYP